MRRKFSFAIGLLASVAAGGGSAVAADLSVKAPPEVPAAVSDWTGFYVGVHGGYGWGHTSFESEFVSNSPLLLEAAPPKVPPKGAVFGGQVGYNWQWGSVVGGLETDFSGTDIKEASPFTIPIQHVTPPAPLTNFSFSQGVKIDELASARARFGYLALPNLLLYGTGGVGWGHSELDTNQLDNGTGVTVAGKSFNDEIGWVAGAGLEWKLWDHWLLRAEYLHYDFARHNNNAIPNFFFPGTTTPPFFNPVSSTTTIDIARAALSYKF